MRGEVIDRKRTNQPQGYLAGAHHNAAPVTHFCRRHNYLYYPYSWTDEATGSEYEQGYYDEDGQYYKDVVFMEDGKYKNVVCQCEYCDSITKLDWTEGGALICPQCGGSMKILSTLDEYTQDPQYAEARRQAGYVDYADRNGSAGRRTSAASANGRSVGTRIVAWAILALVLLSGIFFVYRAIRNHANANQGGSGQNLTNPERFGKTLYLRRDISGGYVISNSSDYEKKLVWDSTVESYYDDESGFWLWYNTDVKPALWQYWYEPISGHYGSYGWMEYENETWYIETSQGRWIEVPEKYDTSPLWHIETDE